MKKYIVSLLILMLLLFSYSCQKKVVHIPVVPKVLITENQVEKPIKNQTTEDIDKKNKSKTWVKSDFVMAEPDFLINKSTIMSDPYKEFGVSINANSQPMLDRFYQDLDDDGFPEMLLEWNTGTGGGNYSIFKIRKDGYLYLGSIFVWSYSTLQTKHYGFHDLMMFSRLWDLDDDTWGTLQIYEFNGIKYEAVKMMDISFKDAIKEGIFTPDKRSNEATPEEKETKWSPKDDDKYRRMIK
jgi:hypothetical protein